MVVVFFFFNKENLNWDIRVEEIVDLIEKEGMKCFWIGFCWIKYDSIFLVDSNFFFDLFFLDF